MFDAGYMKMRDLIYYETCVELIWPLDFFFLLRENPTAENKWKFRCFIIGEISMSASLLLELNLNLEPCNARGKGGVGSQISKNAWLHFLASD